jgi:hypothetical protein
MKLKKQEQRFKKSFFLHGRSFNLFLLQHLLSLNTELMLGWHSTADILMVRVMELILEKCHIWPSGPHTCPLAYGNIQPIKKIPHLKWKGKESRRNDSFFD